MIGEKDWGGGLERRTGEDRAACTHGREVRARSASLNQCQVYSGARVPIYSTGYPPPRPFQRRCELCKNGAEITRCPTGLLMTAMFQQLTA